MEKDKELKGDGNSYTTEFRQYDPRLGRWLSLDPLASSFPWQSPYCAFDNNPVLFVDPLGLSAGTKDGKINNEPYEGGGAGDKGKPNLIDFTDMKTVTNKSNGQKVIIPSKADVKYNSKGDLIEFSYSYKDPLSANLDENRLWKGELSNTSNKYIYTEYDHNDKPSAHYYSGGFYSNETEAYKAMWETTQNKEGTWVNTERNAYITEKGVWISTNAFSDGDYSINTIKTVVKDGELYIENERVLARIHTHPKLDNVGNGGFSAGDVNHSDGIQGAYEIIMEFNNNVSIGSHDFIEGGFLNYPTPDGLTRDSLINGEFKLIPFLINRPPQNSKP